MTARAIINGVDVTEHVAAMYDAIIGSADWGSNFLDTETIVSILTIGRAMGFDRPALSVLPDGFGKGTQPQRWTKDPEQMPRIQAAWAAWHTEQLAKWQAQVDAMVAANLSDEAAP